MLRASVILVSWFSDLREVATLKPAILLICDLLRLASSKSPSQHVSASNSWALSIFSDGIRSSFWRSTRYTWSAAAFRICQIAGHLSSTDHSVHLRQEMADVTLGYLWPRNVRSWVNALVQVPSNCEEMYPRIERPAHNFVKSFDPFSSELTESTSPL